MVMLLLIIILIPLALFEELKFMAPTYVDNLSGDPI